MREEILHSVGIDIGTSTTQCVFSSLTFINSAPVFAVPRIVLKDRSVLYRAPLRLTPLLSADTINAEALRALVEAAYHEAGIRPEHISLGAVIITGEAAKKKNARAVAEALAGLAGEFVVATAGPMLEAVLAGKGSGAAALARENGRRVLNLDIGGGTSNLCLFDRGEPVETGCVSVGGRLIRREAGTGTLQSFTEAAGLVAKDVGIPLRSGEHLSDRSTKAIAARMAGVLEEAVNLRPRTVLYETLVVERGLPETLRADLFTFSGGVAESIYGGPPNPLFSDDIGSFLAEAVASSRFFTEARVLRPAETLHATVIGAGAYSVAVSGSTVALERAGLPMKNLPVGIVPLESPSDVERLAECATRLREALGEPFAIGFSGWQNPSYDEIEAIASALNAALPRHGMCPVIIVEHDLAKALGQALSRMRGADTPLICLDGISLAYGDQIDIGAPLSSGRAVPVVVKTFAFSHDRRGGAS